MHVGQLIKQHREMEGMTQFDLCLKAKVRTQTISKIERTGNGYFAMVLRLAEAVGIKSIPTSIHNQVKSASLTSD